MKSRGLPAFCALFVALLVALPAASLAPAASAAAPDPAPSPLVVTLGAPANVWTGHAAKLSGTVSPAPPAGTSVAVEWRREDSAAWSEVPLTASLDGTATAFAFTWRPSDHPHGVLVLRARVATPDGATFSSPGRRVVVNPWNRFRVPYEEPHSIVIVVHEYELYYFEHGELVRSFVVALGRPGFPTPIGLFHIYGKRKPGGGPLGSCAMFYRREGGIAIHGTNEPWLLSRPIPRNFSHGCARMHDTQALWLYARCPTGTPVRNFR